MSPLICTLLWKVGFCCHTHALHHAPPQSMQLFPGMRKAFGSCPHCAEGTGCNLLTLEFGLVVAANLRRFKFVCQVHSPAVHGGNFTACSSAVSPVQILVMCGSGEGNDHVLPLLHTNMFHAGQLRLVHLK